MLIKKHISTVKRKIPVNFALKFAGVVASLKDVLMIPSNSHKVTVVLGGCDPCLTCMIYVGFQWASDTSSTGCRLCLK